MLEASATRSATPLDGPTWSGRLGVVSPHLDDAVLSLGVAIRAATRRGASVDVVTVMAGDPTSSTRADDSNRRAGFSTAGEAARLRRKEDRRACRLVGARPVWLTLSNDRNDGLPDEAEVRNQLADSLVDYDAILLPGFPLTHPHHLQVGRLAVEVLEPGTTVGFYVEQPYASWAALARNSSARGRASPNEGLRKLGVLVDRPAKWTRASGTALDWVGKIRAINAYASQLQVLRRGPRTRILAYEALHGGEAVLWVSLS